MQAKKEYNILKDSGDLFDMFPSFTGEWEQDKTEFTRMWEANIEITEDFELDIGEEEY